MCETDNLDNMECITLLWPNDRNGKWSVYLARRVQLLEDFLQLIEIVAIEVQLAQLRVSLEPQPVVFGVAQRV